VYPERHHLAAPDLGGAGESLARGRIEGLEGGLNRRQAFPIERQRHHLEIRPT
jgi:hypothetical protein